MGYDASYTQDNKAVFFLRKVAKFLPHLLHFGMVIIGTALITSEISSTKSIYMFFNNCRHTPRTTDHRHIRQDRRIQTELASTLAKNATKSNPFEIIPLHTTGKENNWKTEETLARAAVTLRRNGSKGPILGVYDDE